MYDIESCSKCMCPIASDAVFLKNGTYMCPSCYHRMYPPKKVSSGRRHIFISVEGVIAIIAVIGVIFLGSKVFHYVMDMRREDAAAARAAEEAAEKRRHEEMLLAEERRKTAELERKAADAKAQIAREQAAERRKQLEIERAAAQKKLLQEELALAEAKAKQEKDEADAKVTTAEMERSEQLLAIAKEVADAKKTLAQADSEKNELQRKAGIYRTGLNRASDIKAGLLAQYRAQFPDTPPKLDDVPRWRRPPPAKTGFLGRIPVTISRADEYQVLVTKFDNAAGDVRSNEERLKATLDDIKKADTAITRARTTVANAGQKLKELKATLAELAASGIADAKPAAKMIVKKDGTQIRALAIINLEDEVRYKDEDGQWQSIAKSDVDKIQ